MPKSEKNLSIDCTKGKTSAVLAHRRKSPKARKPENIGVAAKTASKTADVIGMLSRAAGTTLDEIVNATGWRRHTARAALSGLKKKGHTIISERADGVRRYRVGTPA
jgi:hypothetical protein